MLSTLLTLAALPLAPACAPLPCPTASRVQEAAPAAQEPAPERQEAATQEPASGGADQDAKPRSRRRPGAELPPNGPDALAFLGELIEAQTVGEELPAVEGFAMLFQLREFDPDRGGNELDVRVDFRAGDADRVESVRMVVDDPAYGTRVAKGFDAGGYWLRDADGRLLTLEAKEYQADREGIEQTLTFCEDFLLLFDLDRLRRRAGGLTLERGDAGRTLTGQMRRTGRQVWRFSLFVPEGASLPVRLTLTPPDPRAADMPAADGQAGDTPDADTEAADQPAAEAKTEPGADNEAASSAPPQRLVYLFGDWTEHRGRLLPSYIDEFRADDLEYPRRSINVERFAWRDPSVIRTNRNDAVPDGG